MSMRGIVKEEWWPVLELTDPGETWADVHADVPDELVTRYEIATAEFMAVQDALRALPEWADADE